MEKRVVSHSAPYGHACMSCFKGKCRCIPRQDGNGCERCHRLKKHCVPSNQIRRRTLHHGPELDGQIASRSNSEGDMTAKPQPKVRGSTGLERLEGFQFEAAIRPSFATPHGTSSSTTPESLGLPQVTGLDMFRSQMLPHLPFLQLPAHMTARQLHLRRPFLLQAITCVASSTTRERLTRGIELKRVLYGMVFNPQHQNGLPSEAVEHKLDLLLGLLTYIAWGWDHSLSNRLTMLSMSLVGEMQLDKPVTSDAGTVGLVTLDVELDAVAHNHRSMMAENSVDHQRAVLACYLLSSAVSAYCAQIDALRWTPHMERALAAISDTGSQHDQILAVQVRLQLLTAQAIQIRDQGHRLDHNEAEMLLIKLEELRPTVGQHQEQGPSLTTHFRHTELAIHEALDATAPLPVAVAACPPPSARPITNGNTTAAPPNLTHLWNALLATQSTTTTLLSLPATSIPTTASHTGGTTTISHAHSHFRGIAFPQWAQLVRCVAALRRFEAPDPRWPDGAAREVVDLAVLLEKVVETLEGMAREAGEVLGGNGSGIADRGPRNEEGTFMALALRLRKLREKVLKERAGVDKPGVAAPRLDGGGGVAVDTEGKKRVLPPQMGYFRNPRFWLDQIWDLVE